MILLLLLNEKHVAHPHSSTAAEINLRGNTVGLMTFMMFLCLSMVFLQHDGFLLNLT